MTLHEKIYRRLLREAMPDLGDVQFSPHRKDGASKEEPDTPEEKELYDNFVNWFRAPRYLTAGPSFKDDIIALMHSKKYGRYFKEPDADVVWRGMHVSSRVLAKWLGHPEGIRPPPWGEEEVDFILSSKHGSGVSSWSLKKSMADQFAQSDAEYKEYCVVFGARVSDNKGKFLDADDMMLSTDFETVFNDECEVMGLGDIRVRLIQWQEKGDEPYWTEEDSDDH